MTLLSEGIQRLAFESKNESQTYSQLGLVFNKLIFLTNTGQHSNMLIFNTLQIINLWKFIQKKYKKRAFKGLSDVFEPDFPSVLQPPSQALSTSRHQIFLQALLLRICTPALQVLYPANRHHRIYPIYHSLPQQTL